MNCLLDTCALLWLVNGDPQLGRRARAAIRAPEATVFLSVISAAELAIKVGKGRLTLAKPVADWVTDALRLHHLTLLTLDLVPAAAAGALPWIHSDPFDRLLIATARHLGLPILTPDPVFAAYPGAVVVW